MARDDPPRLIPTADRGREQIAARYTSRVRRLYGTGDQAVPPEPAILSVFLSADEVIGLIAYGRTAALSLPAPGAPPVFERWKSHLTGGSCHERQYPLVQQMRLVLARVRWWKQRKHAGVISAECPVKPLDPIARGHVRWAIHTHKRSAVGTVALLRNDIRKLLSAQAAHRNSIDHATAILCAEIAAERLDAWGRPGIWRKRQFKSGMHELIPAVFFANPHNTIRDGWATGADSLAMDIWANWNGPDWGDVRFKRDDVLALLGRRLAQTDEEDHRVNEMTTGIGNQDDDQELSVTIDQLHQDRQRRMAVRRRLQDRIIESIRLSRELVSFADIAEWCAREKGSIEPDERLRSEAYKQLGAALTSGEFGAGRQSRVLFLHPLSSWAKMTPERFHMIPFAEEGRIGYLRYCWAPTELATRWAERRNLTLPRHLLPPENIAADPPVRTTMVKAARTSLAIPNKPGGGGNKSAAATKAMVEAVRQGRVRFDELRRMKQKQLASLYPDAGRTTLHRCRETALAALSAASHSDKVAT